MEESADARVRRNDARRQGWQEGGHGQEEPTLFKTDATEFGLIFDVSAGDLTRKIVFNTADQDSSIIGEEAFMLPVSIKETTLPVESPSMIQFSSPLPTNLIPLIGGQMIFSI